MKTLCIIPAKGASTRLPRKNVILFCGKPLIYYTIVAAQKAAIFDDIIVSTEDVLIREIATGYGAEVMLRPEHLATDPAGVADVCVYTVDKLKEAGREYANLCILYPSAPLRDEHDIQGAFQLYQTGRGRSVFSVGEFDHPPFRAVTLHSGGRMEFLFPEFKKKKAQELPPAYHITGAIIIVKIADFLKHKTYFLPPQLAYILPRNHAVDIDTLHDLRYAEFLKRG